MAKTIPLTQLTLLEKCLGMIGSAHDGEAAAAGRKATAILKAHDFTWAELLRKQVVTVASNGFDDGPAPAPDTITATNNHIQKCLDTLRGKDLGAFTKFIESLDKDWAEKRYLSVEQRRALFAAYERNK